REVQPLPELAPWVDPKLAEVVKRALARKPDDRFASAEELAAALKPHATLKEVTPAAFKSGSEERRKIAAGARSARSQSGVASSKGRAKAKPKGVGMGVVIGL